MTKLENNTKNDETKQVKYTLDKYTKIVLSIIAICLTVLTFNNVIKPKSLQADNSVQDVNIKSINGSSLWGDELPVNIKKINNQSTSDNIPIDIQYINGRSVWGDQIPVDLKSVNGTSIHGSEVPVKVK
jgi:hypothetical protein